MTEHEIIFTGSGFKADGKINRRHFLKAGVVFLGGISGGGLIRIAKAAAGQKGAVAEAIMIGAYSEVLAKILFYEPVSHGLRIASGDTVTIETGFCPKEAAGKENPSMDWTVGYRKEMAGRPDIYFPLNPAVGSMKGKNSFGQARFFTPIDVENTIPGDILQVEILSDGFTKDKTEWFRADLENGVFEPLSLMKPLDRKDQKTVGLARTDTAKALYMPVYEKGVRIITGFFLFEENRSKAGSGVSEEDCRSVTLCVTIRKDLKEADLPVSMSNRWAALGVASDSLSCRGAAVGRFAQLPKAVREAPDKAAYIFCGMGAGHHVSQHVSRRAVLTHMRGE